MSYALFPSKLFYGKGSYIPPFKEHTCYLSTIFCPSPESLKRMKKLFSDYGLHNTKTVSCEVSDGVGFGTVWQVLDGGSNPAGALCELLPSLLAATHTAMPPLTFAPTLGYIQVPRC